MSETAPKRRGGLGRGLSALIGDASPVAATGSSSAATDSARDILGQVSKHAGTQDSVRMVGTTHISPNPRQPRTVFDEATLAELASSIREHGILQPLIVTHNPQQEGDYWLIAGERRLRAAVVAGLGQVPVIVREATPRQLMEWALVENIQRADLNPIEEATAYQALVSEYGLTHEEVAGRVGKSRSAITNLMRLLKLPAFLQNAVVERRISEGHARALVPLSDEASMKKLFAEIVARELTVRQVEALVRQWMEQQQSEATVKAAEKATSPQLRAHLSQLENQFRSAFGTKVSLNRNADGSGKLVVHFFSDDDLETIYRVIAPSTESSGDAVNRREDSM